MTELERLELVLCRVYTELNKTPRYAVHDTMFVLKHIIDALRKENIDRRKVRRK